MKNTTQLPSLEEFKKEAKSLKRTDKSHKTLNSALNALALRFGYKSWNVIKTKLISVPDPITEGILAIECSTTPPRVLGFVFDDKKHDMTYTAKEGDKTLYEGHSLSEASRLFKNSELKAYEVELWGKSIKINNTPIPESVYGSKDAPYRYASMLKVMQELGATHSIPSAEVLNVMNSEGGKNEGRGYVFRPIHAPEKVISYSVDPDKFNSICQNMLDQTKRYFGNFYLEAGAAKTARMFREKVGNEEYYETLYEKEDEAKEQEGPNKCTVCGNRDVLPELFETEEGGVVRRTIHCTNEECQATWTETFRYSDYKMD